MLTHNIDKHNPSRPAPACTQHKRGTLHQQTRLDNNTMPFPGSHPLHGSESVPAAGIPRVDLDSIARECWPFTFPIAYLDSVGSSAIGFSCAVHREPRQLGDNAGARQRGSSHHVLLDAATFPWAPPSSSTPAGADGEGARLTRMSKRHLRTVSAMKGGNVLDYF